MQKRRKRLKRIQLDAIAWQILHWERKLSAHLSDKKSGRPANYRNLGELLDAGGDFDSARGDFLHEFYAYQMPEFSAEPF